MQDFDFLDLQGTKSLSQNLNASLVLEQGNNKSTLSQENPKLLLAFSSLKSAPVLVHHFSHLFLKDLSKVLSQLLAFLVCLLSRFEAFRELSNRTGHLYSRQPSHHLRRLHSGITALKFALV